MTLRLFADHCISTSIIGALREAGCDVLRLKDHIPADSADPVVIAKAQELDCVLLSLNSDFADIVTYPPTGYKGIISLQMRNHPEIEPHLIAKLRDYLSAHPRMDHYSGKLLVVEVHRIRIRE